MIMIPKDTINIEQRTRRVLTDVRQLFKDNNTTMKERMEFFDTEKWINFFNNAYCEKEILEALEENIIEMYMKHTTYEEIYKKLGVTRHQIRAVAERRKLPIRIGSESKKLLKPTQVKEILKSIDGGVSDMSISNKYDVSPATIRNIRVGITYKDEVKQYNNTTT